MQKKRRRQGKTDYKTRLNLLKGEKPRIVIRKTNKYIIIQYVTSEEARDKVKIGVSSKSLLKYGWNKEYTGSLKSVPASYLTGYLIGKKIIEIDGKDAIIDIGMLRNTKKSRISAAMKGIADSGMKINFNGEVDAGRIEGKHMKKEINIKSIKEKINNETE